MYFLRDRQQQKQSYSIFCFHSANGQEQQCSGRVSSVTIEAETNDSNCVSEPIIILLLIRVAIYRISSQSFLN